MDWRKRRTPFYSSQKPCSGQRVIAWVLPSHDLRERATGLLDEITDAQAARDPGKTQALVAELTSMPNFPRHQPGDRIEIEVRRPIIVLPN